LLEGQDRCPLDFAGAALGEELTPNGALHGGKEPPNNSVLLKKTELVIHC
jgi:hypothetical protein